MEVLFLNIALYHQRRYVAEIRVNQLETIFSSHLMGKTIWKIVPFSFSLVT